MGFAAGVKNKNKSTRSPHCFCNFSFVTTNQKDGIPSKPGGHTTEPKRGDGGQNHLPAAAGWEEPALVTPQGTAPSSGALGSVLYKGCSMGSTGVGGCGGGKFPIPKRFCGALRAGRLTAP